ncbi:MAG: ABC-F type ribosomal protection protein [Ruminiclostridium sp.]|nr:ABC-F type ribosomal protection protein [Ruminiclostridium sp.]
MSIINITNLTFAYDGGYENIFENVSFRIDTDWKTGLTGRNGRGKTTFLKLLMKEYEYRGVISASTDFEYFPYKVSSEEFTTIEVIEEIAPEVQYWQISREINLLETEEEILYRPFGTLSKGEQTKALLAAMFLKENAFLLIDEPTNHLDIKGRESVSRYLNGKKGFILVSHDRLFLDSCIDHIMSINRSDIQIQKGNFSSWLQNKERQDSFELAENNKLKKEIKRLEKAVKETTRWSDKAESRKIGIDPMKIDNKSGYRPLQAAKSKKLMARAKAIETRREDALEEKTKLLKNIESADKLKIGQLEYRSERLLTVQKLSAGYGGAPVFEDISLEIINGDRIWLQGSNGSGKSTLIKLILGSANSIIQKGIIEKGSGLKISYVPQDTSDLQGRLSDYAKEYDIEDSFFKAILSKLNFSDLRFDRRIEDMSMGQKKKVLIARSLCEKVHLHIWDEPMNYIDVISRMQIEEVLLEFKPTVLFVEHDRAFGEKIANKVISL